MENKSLDSTDMKILQLLQENARITYADLAKQVGLTAPAVTERIRKMEHAEILTGYRAEVDLRLLGYDVQALVLIEVAYKDEQSFIRYVQEKREVLECHHLLGQSAFSLKVCVKRMLDLEALIRELMKFGQTTTHILLSEVVRCRSLDG
ncbi:Lrp/AsnC family transcriptional regulator [Deinococcus cellulosilyticus]|uniref:AsnC family transcriptional regulator n=1 Tax=Deinococcus cellulosilyticus (strain DSM 18568 / NBRC 106333 / KACC 11606 / 5516J-15) TaxID=1223518 RepID=A0A511MXS3_DEIC1|nr:Lrp/AsnC family transcriptional regulator [Deinococcus cellulosilyticus]GEM44957.1 AsnC family transcriptional regulator [Deinococcus cellulosilyticus NBRC 106333 = KACC 11606]